MPIIPTPQAIHIAVGIVEDTAGRVLVSQRRVGTHGAGEWEFPGGKVDPGESVYQALIRELREELGIGVAAARPLIRVRHVYSDRTVILDTWRVTDYSGAPSAVEGQAVQWLDVTALAGWPLMAADGPIVNALGLPHTYLFTGTDANAPTRFLDRLVASLARGVRLVRLRAPTLDAAAYRALAQQVITRCHDNGAVCLLDRDADLVEALGADGLHVPTRTLMALTARPVEPGRWFAASCHNAEQLRQAECLGADFAVLSPVKPTPTHAGEAPLGWYAFSELVEGINLPVFALGGLGPGDALDAWRHGAQGIAAIRGLWV